MCSRISLIFLALLSLSSSSSSSSSPLNISDLFTSEYGVPLHRPFATRLFLTGEPNKLNLAWSCNQGNKSINHFNSSATAEVWYGESEILMQSVISQLSVSCETLSKTASNPLEVDKWKVCSYNTTVSLKEKTSLSYRVSCNGTFSQKFEVRYKYWDPRLTNTVQDTWVLMSVGSLGFYNTTKLTIRILEEISKNSGNVLWAIPGGLLYDAADTDSTSLSEAESQLRWLLWLQMIENVTCCTPVVAALSPEDGYIPGQDPTYFSYSNFDSLLELPYVRNDSSNDSRHMPWFSFNHRNLHVVSICTFCDLSDESEQFRWLEKDLEQANKTSEWIMVMGHEPFYDTSEPVNSVAKLQLDKLFDKYNVDFAVWSHERWYERTMPIRNSRVTDARKNNFLKRPDGTIHYTCGTGGMPLHSFNMDKFNHSAHYKDDTFGVCVFAKSSASQIETMFAYLMDGLNSDLTQYDLLTISKSPSPPPPSPSQYHSLNSLSVSLITASVVAVLIVAILFCFITPKVLKTIDPAVVINKIRALKYKSEVTEEDVSPDSMNMMEDPSNYGDKVMLIAPYDDEDDTTSTTAAAHSSILAR